MVPPLYIYLYIKWIEPLIRTQNGMNDFVSNEMGGTIYIKGQVWNIICLMRKVLVEFKFFVQNGFQRQLNGSNIGQ